MATGDYVDWLKTVRDVGGPCAWVRQRRHILKCSIHDQEPSRRTPKEIVNHVLGSPRVKEACQQYCMQNKKDMKVAQALCREIIDKMAHNYTLDRVRWVGYVLAKVISIVFDEVLVNNFALRALRETFRDTPVVFVPSHRSYVDFMLLSILCFDQEVALPAIAAAMDFMNSPLIGEALRQCGAFFIRRAVGEDILYWSIFTEYVQTHIIKGDHPVEFFIEGTRSRVGKSIIPKYGLLQILMEPYLRGKIYDMVVVPVSMNYDKLLEEQLYGYELLGFPKPKESANGLLKARSILDKHFGRATITFCKPFSIRDHLGVSIKRSAFVCQPDSQWKMEEKEKRVIRRFGHNIVRAHHDNAAVTVWPIVSLSILKLNDECRESPIALRSVLGEFAEYMSILKGLDARLDIRRTVEEDVLYFFGLHSDLFTSCNFGDSDSSFSLLQLPVEQGKSKVSKIVLQQAVVPIILTNYANEAMHLLSGPSLFALALQTLGGRTTVQQLKAAFTWLREFLYHEFVFDSSVPEFETLVQKFEKTGYVIQEDDMIEANNDGVLRRLALITLPLLSTTSVVIDTLIRFHPLLVTQDEVVKAAQVTIAEMHEKGTGIRISSLCTEVIKNAFLTLNQCKCLEKKAKNYAIFTGELEKIGKKISAVLQSVKTKDASARL